MKKKYVVELTKEERLLKLVSAGESSARRRMLNYARVLSKADVGEHASAGPALADRRDAADLGDATTVVCASGPSAGGWTPARRPTEYTRGLRMGAPRRGSDRARCSGRECWSSVSCRRSPTRDGREDAQKFAGEVRRLVVVDNLSTHSPSAFYETFPPEFARLLIPSTSPTEQIGCLALREGLT